MRNRNVLFPVILLAVILIGLLWSSTLFSKETAAYLREQPRIKEEFITRYNMENSGISFNEETFINAVLQGNTELVKSFLQAGMNPNVIAPRISSPAIFAAVNLENLEMVRLLVHFGGIVNAIDGSWNSPLMIAAQKGNSDIVLFLLESGANVNLKNTSDVNAVWFASNAKVTKILLDAGAKPHMQIRDSLQTALWYADFDKAQLLLQAGVNPDIQDIDGNTALMYAVTTDDLKKVSLLLSAGADPNIHNKHGETALKLIKRAMLIPGEGGAGMNEPMIYETLVSTGAKE